MKVDWSDTIEKLIKPIDESAKNKCKEFRGNIKQWLEVYFEVTNEALEKLKKKEPDAWSYALAVLREMPRDIDIIVNMAKSVGTYPTEHLEKELQYVLNDFEHELARQAQQYMEAVGK